MPRRRLFVQWPAAWSSLALVSLLVVLNVMTAVTASSREPRVALFTLASIYIFVISSFWYLSSFSSAAPSESNGSEPPAAWVRIGIALVVAGLSVGAVVNYAQAIASDPGYTQHAADMIPKMFHAIRRVLNDHPMYEVSPLRRTYLATHLPGLILSFLPAALLDLDIRFMGTLYYGLLLFAICASIASSRSKETHWFFLPLVGFFALPGLVTAFLPQAHTPWWWLLLFFFCLAVHRGFYVTASLLLAAMLFTRETAVIIAAFYAIHLYKAFGLKVTALHLGAVALVNVILWIPFFDEQGLREALQVKSFSPDRSWLNPAARIKVLNTIGFSNLFYLAGLQAWLRPTIVVGLLGLLAHHLIREETDQRFFFGCAAGVLWSLYLYGKPIIYEYIPLPLLWAFGLLSATPVDRYSPATELRAVLSRLKTGSVLPGVVLGATVLLALVIPHYRNPVRFDFVGNRQDVRGKLYEREAYASGDFAWAGEEPITIHYPLRNIELSDGYRIVFYFKVRPYTCGGERQQSVEVFANGEFIARIDLKPDWHEFRVDVPTSYLQIGTNTFTLVPAYVSWPGDCSDRDPRRLSVAYEYMVMVGATADAG
jgi:hypothetical protein